MHFLSGFLLACLLLFELYSFIFSWQSSSVFVLEKSVKPSVTGSSNELVLLVICSKWDSFVTNWFGLIWFSCLCFIIHLQYYTIVNPVCSRVIVRWLILRSDPNFHPGCDVRRKSFIVLYICIRVMAHKDILIQCGHNLHRGWAVVLRILAPIH